MGRRQKLSIILENKVHIEKLILSKNVNIKKCESNFGTFWQSPPLIQNSEFDNFLWTHWFLCKNLSNFVPPAWKTPQPILPYLSKQCLLLQSIQNDFCTNQQLLDHFHEDLGGFHDFWWKRVVLKLDLGYSPFDQFWKLVPHSKQVHKHLPCQIMHRKILKWFRFFQIIFFFPNLKINPKTLRLLGRCFLEKLSLSYQIFF